MLETESNGCPSEANSKLTSKLTNNKGESHVENENHIKNDSKSSTGSVNDKTVVNNNTNNSNKDANSNENNGQDSRDESAKASTNKNEAANKIKSDSNLRLQNSKSKLANSSKIKPSKTAKADKSSDKANATSHIGNSVVVTEGDLPKQQQQQKEHQTQSRGKSNPTDQVIGVKLNAKSTLAATKITRSEARSSTSPATAKIVKKSKTSLSNQSQAQVVAKKSTAIPSLNSDKTGAIKNSNEAIKKKKRKQVSSSSEQTSNEDEEELDGEPRTSKRVRSQYQPFQSPEALAALAPALYKPPSKPSTSASKNTDDKIVVFSKGDFLAVRNEEGTFFVCRTAQNVYKSSRRFKIQWLNDEKEADVYTPDFYDQTDFECVLTNLKMVRKDKGKYMLPADERKRTMNILERAINVEKGLTEIPDPRNVVSDGVDVSIVGKEEEQELMKINPKPRIKISKEKPAKISSPSSASSGRPKRPSTHEEKEISLRERRRSSEISHKSTSRPSTSVKRERRASNPAPPEAPLEDRRSTRSTSRSIVKEEKKTSASTLSTAVNKSPPSSSSSASSSFSASLRKRRLSSNDHLTVKEVTKSERSSRSSHGERQSYPERMRQPSTIKIVNMSTHEAKRPKIRISLIPNPKVSELERELTFESRDDIPFISSIVDSKLLIRAVNRKDYELIDKMVTEGRICSFCVPRSVNLHRDSLSYAIQKEDLPAIKMLMDKKYLTNLVAFPDVLITRSPGKKQNILILGQTNSTPEAMEVLLYDLSHNYDYRCLRQRTFFNSEIIRDALRFGISIDTIDKLCSLDCDKSSNILTLFLNNISAAVKYGHREIAHHLISIAIKKGGFGFHTLHKEALQEKDLFSVAKPSLVVSRSISNCNITPIHCAAINSDEYYISTLLESHSDSYSVQDTEGWHPIHYAAACDSKGPLKYLISKGIPTLVKDKEGNTPLHIACHAGRVHNVELILSHEANNAGDKHSCIERQNKEGLTPLHIACEKGKEEIVKILLQSGADPEKVTLTGNDKLTPLMVAAQNGHLGIVKMLVEKCVDVEALDRRDRTALLHAIINGHSHVVSYLLKLGANPDTKESFGNTAVHFAVAYGWYFTLKLLIDAGSKLNEPNVCNITPLMIGYIKGHLGLVDLLAQSGVTLDSQTADNSDQTLLMETMKSRPGKSMIDRIQFLAKYSADFSRSDREGSNAFHYLADYGEYLVDEPEPSGNEEPEDDFCSEDEEVAIKKQEFNHRKVSRAKKTERLLKYLTQTIKLLRENGCDYAACNNLKETCFHKAAKYGYFDLIEALLESDCKLSESINEDGNTLLHLIVRHSPTRCLQLLPCFKKSENSIERLRNMMKVQNRLGEVPLASCLINYKSLDKDEQEPDLIDFMVNTLQADVKINVPLETIKNETCINFVNKYCTPKIIGIIQKRLDLQIKESSLNETKKDVSTAGISDNTPATVSKPSESAASQAITVTTTPSPLIQPVPSSDSVSNNLPIPLTQEKSEQKLSSQTSITNNVASKFISNSTVTSETQQPQAQIIKVAETPKTIPIISTTTAATVAPSPLLAQTLTTSSVQSTVAETTHSAQSASVPTPVIAATPSITPISTTPSTQQPTVAQSNLSSKISAKPLDQAELQFKETNEPSVDSHHPQTQVITNKSQTIQAQIETQQQSAAPQSESAVPPQPSIQPQSQTQLQPTAVNICKIMSRSTIISHTAAVISSSKPK